MNNFTHSIPTKVYFGKGQIKHLAELKESGSKVLLVYGGGSIKKNGLYNKVYSILRTAGLRIYELPGVEPNPRIESVREGVKICKDNKVNMVLAVGGGSVIDAAKVIAGGAGSVFFSFLHIYFRLQIICQPASCCILRSFPISASMRNGERGHRSSSPSCRSVIRNIHFPCPRSRPLLVRQIS